MQILQFVIPWGTVLAWRQSYPWEMTRKKQVSPKLMPKWKGPYMVVKHFGIVYEII